MPVVRSDDANANEFGCCNSVRLAAVTEAPDSGVAPTAFENRPIVIARGAAVAARDSILHMLDTQRSTVQANELVDTDED